MDFHCIFMWQFWKKNSIFINFSNFFQKNVKKASKLGQKRGRFFNFKNSRRFLLNSCRPLRTENRAKYDKSSWLATLLKSQINSALYITEKYINTFSNHDVFWKNGHQGIYLPTRSYMKSILVNEFCLVNFLKLVFFIPVWSHPVILQKE